MPKIKLMSHLVAGYPTDELSFTAASAMVRGGADILEIQLPFSDPSADGPAIQEACTQVLHRHYRTEEALNFIGKLHKAFPQTTLYIMSYASLIYTPGIENFCERASAVGVKGMIVPDLPFDYDEGLTAACKKFGMENIPVASPSMSGERLFKMATAGFEHIYASLRVGITGTATVIDRETLDFLKHVGAGGSKIYGGFGISNGEQSKAIAGSVEAVVAGSVFVRLIREYTSDREKLFSAVENKAKELCGI